MTNKPLAGIRIKVSVLMRPSGYQGIVTGSIGRQTVWIDRTYPIRDNIMQAYTDAQCMAASVQA